MKKTLLFVLTTLLFIACKHELEKPTWDVDMITPISNTSLNINNIITKLIILLVP